MAGYLSRWPVLVSFVLHVLTGFLAVGAHYSAMWVLMQSGTGGVAASAAGFGVGAFVRFVSSYFKVFSPGHTMPVAARRFVVALLFQWVANLALLGGLLRLEWSIWGAQVVTTVLLTFLNFAVYRLWVFRSEAATENVAAGGTWFGDIDGHLRALTGLRGWAALWVCLYHVWTFSKYPALQLPLGELTVDLTPLVSIGFAGVTVFFVLSGFLLALPYIEWQAGQRVKPTTRTYLLRRVARVFPAYYAQLTILLLLAYWLPGQSSIDTWGALWRHLTMLFVPPPLGTTPINQVWWTLPIEFSFYLALPALAVLFGPRRWPWLLLGSMVCMWLWRYGVVQSMADRPMQDRVYAAYQLPGSLDSFVLGVMAAMAYVHRNRLPAALVRRQSIEALATIGLVVIVGCLYWLAGSRHLYWQNHAIFYLWTPMLALGTSSIVFAAANGSYLTKLLFANTAMVWLGVVSYSLYLWHHPVLEWLSVAPPVPGMEWSRWVELMTYGLPLAIGVAAFAYVAVERPFLLLRRGRYRSAQNTIPPNPR